MTAAELTTIVRNHLNFFALFQQQHGVYVHPIPNTADHWSVGYRSLPGNWVPGSTHFDLNICGDVCHLLFIEVEKRHRGWGHGKQLYELIVAIAKELGCTTVEQTASGKTPRGETRGQYLARHGWTITKDPIFGVDIATKSTGYSSYLSSPDWSI